MNCPFNLVVIDVDNTLTDGTYEVYQNGERSKRFHTRDWYAIEQMLRNNISVLIMTQSGDTVIDAHVNRMRVVFGTKDYLSGEIVKKLYLETKINDKKAKLEEYFNRLEIAPEKTLYIGDAENDIEAMSICSFKGCPNDAIPEIRQIVKGSIFSGRGIISQSNGGSAAVYDIWKKFEGMYS